MLLKGVYTSSEIRQEKAVRPKKCKVNMMRYGQIVLQNIAQCGGCGRIHRFPIWTNRLIIDQDIKKIWSDTYEYGLLCPECTFALFEDCTFRD